MDYSAVNTIWVLVGAALVFFMQARICYGGDRFHQSKKCR